MLNASLAWRFPIVQGDLEVRGWVRNSPDGRVEALFEGEESAVRMALDFARAGPKFARVDHVEVAWEDATGEFADFRVVG